MDARDRMPDVAILHAIGWRDRSLRALMLTEVYARGALALLVAFTAAPFLERTLLRRLSIANDFVMLPVPAPWMPFVLAALCALAFPLAAYPAWRSVRGLAPARALRLLARE
jgi:ABC-type antimicrobial peptide transport system permease subunit